MELNLDKSAVREFENFVINKIEEIIFGTKRPSGKRKLDGDYYIKDDTGQLRRKLKANKGFLKSDKKGLVFDIKMISYYKYLDDQRRDDLNWYLTEAIFEDDDIRKKLKELTAQSAKRTFLNILSEANKTK